MAKNELRHLTVRIDDKTLDKLHYVADYEGRSANSQILILIRDCIEAYEAKHGEIKTGKRD
ncbi:MAG: Arc family DNA-binding protein [Ruminococcaceae bacterium]|nr:Arc family DNA-binding protein [Oscillospiraceae bacterium]